MKSLKIRCFSMVLIMIVSQELCAQNSYEWRQSRYGGAWSTTWRNSPHELAAAYCEAVGAPQDPGQKNGSFLQSCKFEENVHGWPYGNVKTVSIKHINCILPGGCQQSIQYGSLAQGETRAHVNEYYTSITPEGILQCGSSCNVVGDPIVPANGGVFKAEADIAFPRTLQFKRYYNSVNSNDYGMSVGWTHSFVRRLEKIYQSFQYRPYDSGDPDNSSLYDDPELACENGFPEVRARVSNWQSAVVTYTNAKCVVSVGGVTVGAIPILSNIAQDPQPSSTIIGFKATRDDGRVVDFSVQGSTISAHPVEKLTLQEITGGYSITDGSDNVETYNTDGQLLSITASNGVTQTLAYDGAQRLDSVTDSFSRGLEVEYDILGRLISVTDPGGRVVQYAYDSKGRLESVDIGDGTDREYLYEDTSYPHHLTGLIDESSTRLSTWDYDANGRATGTEEAGGANEVSLTYNTDGSVTTTDALGAVRTFTFGRYGDRRQVTSISGSQCPTCTEPTSTAYDLSGFIKSRTDYNGNVTCYSHDATRGLELVRVEGFAPSSSCPSDLAGYTPAGGTRERKIATTWHSTYRLPTEITEPNRTIAFTHDSDGNVLTGTVTDNATSATRTWTWTYNSYGQVLTENGPRTDVSDVTTYTYYGTSATCTATVTGATTTGCKGEAATMTNALSHVTTYNEYNAHGLPLKMTDPNGLVTVLAYDMRQRLTSRIVGNEITSFEYWPTGLLKKVTLPDSSYLLYTHDGAHRMTRVDDSEGNYIVYTLDAMGNRTQEETRDPSNALVRLHYRAFNNLNQLWKTIGSANTAAVTTEFSYDDNGNTTATEGPLGRDTARLYDELNRLKQITDAASGVTQFGYDANDNLTSVNDPRSKVTSYTYNGFGNLTQQSGPDTGTTTHTYDSGGNVATTIDARSETGAYSYDVLNRLTELEYSDQTLTCTYDTGTNNKGRLMEISDNSGATSWTYTTQDRVASREQDMGTVTKTLGYGYSSNGQLSSLTTPSGQTVAYSYTNNRITGITVNTITVLDDVRYDPFGPVSQWEWGNTTLAVRTFDDDGNIIQVLTAWGKEPTPTDDAFRITDITDTVDSTLTWG